MTIIAIILIGVVTAAVVAAVLRSTRADRDPPDAPIDETALSSAERYAVQRLRIMVVDDNPLVGRTITRLLDIHDITMATSGHAALAALSHDAGFDAILYALMMPGMSGVEFAGAVTERFPDLRPRLVFLISGNSSPETRRLLAVSEARWVTKPVVYAQLATCVAQVAALRSA